MEFFTISCLNGISYGLLLFMLSSGLTLIFGMMGVLNFAHASFYMLGAYFAFTTTRLIGYGPALLVAPLLAGTLGALFEKACLRRVNRFGHVPELLVTFGLSFVVLELVQLVWGSGPVDYRIPDALDGPLFTLYGTQFPVYRGFMMLVAVLMLIANWLLLTRTRIGLVIQAALSHPDAVGTLGHNVPRLFTLVFGAGAALAGLAGAIGGNAFVTEPGMAATVGSVIFVVVVVGGLGSLAGAFAASLLIGVAQTFAVGADASLSSVLQTLGLTALLPAFGHALWSLKISQVAPILPFLLLIVVMIVRPRGLLGTREG